MSESQKILFHYIKSNFFRVIHVDGAIGGLTPTGDIFLSLYSQRGPIPTLTVQPIEEGGRELGKEILEEREGRKGLIREVEVGIAIRPEIARQLMVFLQEKIELADKVQQQAKNEVGKDESNTHSNKVVNQ